MVDPIGHAGYLLIFVGMIGIGNNKTIGWPIRLVGEVIWIGLGFTLGLTSIWFWGFMFALVDCYGWYRWRNGIE